jgi:heme/copper-type cytochrome/quinol oxidase subunit 1
MAPLKTLNPISFQPTQPQRWSLLHAYAKVIDSHSAHLELRSWGLLSMMSLGVAGVFALLLALSRVPGAEEIIPWPVQFFEKGLVLHVILSFVVWFLSVLGALVTLVTYRLSDGWLKLEALGTWAIIGSFTATVLLFIPAWMDRGEASLNNYVPVIIDNIYYAGLIILAISISLVVIRMFVNLIGRKGPMEPITVSVLATGFMYLLAIGCFIAAYLEIISDASDFAMTPAINEDLFWGGGHILQFVNVGLMLTAWYFLGGLCLGRPWIHPSIMNMAIFFLAATSIAGPFLYIFYETFSAAQTQGFTNLQYFLAPSPVIVIVAAIVKILRSRNDNEVNWKNPVLHFLLLSILVFYVGSFFGLFVDGTDTRTPAHYHGVIGGINLAFMGLFICLFLPLLERDLGNENLAKVSAWLYAVGQILHSSGLFWAGGYGAPRKVAGADQGIEAIGASMGLYLMGIGAVIAVIGGIIFIYLVTQALLKKV